MNRNSVNKRILFYDETVSNLIDHYDIFSSKKKHRNELLIIMPMEKILCNTEIY